MLHKQFLVWLDAFLEANQEKEPFIRPQTFFKLLTPDPCCQYANKKLSCRRRTARCVVSVEICQLPSNSAEATCMTNPEQTEVMKLKHYSKAMCNKHVLSTMTRSSRFRCPVCVVNKPTTVELWISHVY